MIVALGLALLVVIELMPEPSRERVVEIQTRPGVTAKFIEIIGARRTAPKVILFSGGRGKIRLDGWDGSGTPSFNFLVRSRQLFADHGFHVAVPDAPSDRKNLGRGLARWRRSVEHARDIAAIIKHMGKRGAGPVFLVGTSRGTVSTTAIAAHLAKGTLAGIVLSSTMTRRTRLGRRDRVEDMDLARIFVPVMMVHHADDRCPGTVPGDLPALSRKFINAPETKISLHSGGGPWRGRECRARAAHGFPGIEDKVVADMAGWIKTVAAKRR